MTLLSQADDVDTWMLDLLRLVSSEDTGLDDATGQGLLKKHKDVTDDLKTFASTIEALHTIRYDTIRWNLAKARGKKVSDRRKNRG